MVREQFPRLLGDDPAWTHGVRRLAQRTFEFVEFLDKVLSVDLTGLSLPRPRRMTYHYTCHLRGLGVRDEAVRMLRQMGNTDLVPLEKSDQCCGFGGTFAVKYPAISGAIVEDKANCIAATRAQTVVCNDAGCTMNIAGTCRRRGVQVDVRHIAELIAEALGAGVEQW
jgi:L-lactate dehydrogenase complex protein LldE